MGTRDMIFHRRAINVQNKGQGNGDVYSETNFNEALKDVERLIWPKMGASSKMNQTNCWFICKML